MDWNAAIDENREALKRALAMLVALAGLGSHPGEPVEGEPRRTLPRHLYRFILRLLRPAEAAARRLTILAARGIVVALPPLRPRKPRSAPLIQRNGAGTGIVKSPGARPGTATPAARFSLPLADRLPRWSESLRRPSTANWVPRITVPGLTERFPLRRPPSPVDPIDATRLALRLQALGRVLDDLPRQARRFALWRARASEAAASQTSGASGRFRRIWPLRPGRPPGWNRRPSHDVHKVLAVTHGLARWALERRDTS